MNSILHVSYFFLNKRIYRQLECIFATWDMHPLCSKRLVLISAPLNPKLSTGIFDINLGQITDL